MDRHCPHMFSFTCDNIFDRALLKTGRAWREKLAFLNAGCTHPKPGVFSPPFFWHNHHRTWCFYASSVRGLTLPFFEERDPGSTPTALWKKRGPPMSFLHCDMFTFVFRHSFFICVFWRRRNGMRWNFNFAARGARKVFLRTKEKWSITPFFRTGNFQPKFLVWREPADFLRTNKGSLIAKQWCSLYLNKRKNFVLDKIRQFPEIFSLTWMLTSSLLKQWMKKPWTKTISFWLDVLNLFL